jgi:DDE superfamily endonuclease
VVFDRRTGPPLLIASGSTGWASVLETINAVGAWLTPLVIHRGTAPAIPLDCWFSPYKSYPYWRWGFTEKGWTNNEYALEWLKQIFIPELRRGSAPNTPAEKPGLAGFGRRPRPSAGLLGLCSARLGHI